MTESTGAVPSKPAHSKICLVKSLEIIWDDLCEVEHRLLTLFSPLKLDAAACQIIKAGGKRMRPALVLLGGKFGRINKQVIQLAVAVETLHLATLIHDDIIDNADTRRNEPASHVQIGVNRAILLGDFFYAQFLSLISQCGNSALYALSKVVRDLVKAEFQQQSAAFNCHLTEKDYFTRIGYKAGSFLAQCCRLGALLAGAGSKAAAVLATYGYCLGISFQLQDDWLDFAGDQKALGKPVRRDLSGGILTLPVIHCLKNSSRKKELVKAITGGLTDPWDVELLQRELSLCGSLEYTSAQAKKYSRQAMAALQALPPEPAKDALEFLALYAVERTT